MTRNQEIGKFGEILAKKYLIKNNYKILAQNLKISYQEIDIIAKKDQHYIFFEVKTRTSDMFGLADEAFYGKKIENIKKAIENYIVLNKINENYIKIDLISVDIDKNKKIAKIKHFKDIF